MKPPTAAETSLDLVDRKRIALDAEVDLRTLERALDGER